MNTKSSNQWCRNLPAVLIAVGAMLVMTCPLRSEPAGHDEVAGNHSPTVFERTRKMQERMSNRFQHAWKELLETVDPKVRSGNTVSTASVDVREQNDSYVIRIHLPGRDIEKLEVVLKDGGQLGIVAPASAKTGRYAQTITLEGVTSDAKPQVEKMPKEHLVIIRIAKIPAAAEPAPKAEPPAPEKLAPSIDRWDRDVLEHMERMRREMDSIFSEGFKQLGDLPEIKGFFDDPRFGSSVELKEEDGNYVVRAFLPDRDAENVEVIIEDDVILKIDAVADETKRSNDNGTVLKRRAHYSQSLTLPGPVDAEKLMVDRRKDMLVITVPKKPKD